MEEKLIQLIDQSEYVSFDVFDTAVLRAVQKPTDLFDLVEKCFKATRDNLSFHFKTIRVESEKKARDEAWRLKRCAEISLNEIYQCMREDFGIEQNIAENLKRLEIDTETKVCFRNEFIYSVYRYCIEHKKKVIFISDMYLPLDITIQILKNTKYNEFHKIFLSSALGVTKSKGELYQLLLDELSCKPQEVLHIGDNYDSDVIMAQRYGLKTYFYEKCLAQALRCKDLKKNLLHGFLGKKNSIEESLYTATIINHFCSNRESQKNISEYDFWYDFGYKYVGILFFGFNSWLLKQTMEDKVEKLYFLSRDGYIVKKVYDVLSQFFENVPPSEYMYASRRALNLPGIIELDDKTLDFLVSGTSTLRVAQFLERLGFSSTRFSRAIKEAGFSGKDEKVIMGKDYSRLRKLFILVAGDIKEIAAKERDTLFEYFKVIGLFDSKKIGVVDIGWHGTLQHSINKMMELFGKDIEIKGYYLGTFSKARDLSRAGYDMSAYLCEFGQPDDYHNIIKLCVEIFEFIHTAPHGSVINFERINGKIQPVFEQNDYEPKKIEKAQAVQKGALDFIEDLVKIWKHFHFLKISKELAIKPLYRILKSPTYQEAVNLGDLEHAEGFGDVYVKRYIAKPPGFIKSLINPYTFLYGYKQAFWRKGYRKRFFNLSRFFVKSE